MDLSKIGSELFAAANPKAAPPASDGTGSFSEKMGEVLAETNREINHAEAAARELAAGKGDLVETMMSLGRADVSLRMVVSLRNRMLESYQEIMRLQL